MAAQFTSTADTIIGKSNGNSFQTNYITTDEIECDATIARREKKILQHLMMKDELDRRNCTYYKIYGVEN